MEKIDALKISTDAQQQIRYQVKGINYTGFQTMNF